jgi:hypothetical protein
VPASAIRVEGLRELDRAFKNVSKDLQKGLRKELRDVAEPVRALAETKAVSEISHIGPSWSRMRVGFARGTVYVAPKSRRRGGEPRPNLAGALMDRAMQPALDEVAPEIVTRVEAMLDRVGIENGF